MTMFWILAIGLGVVAAAFVVVPIWLHRDSASSSRVNVNLGIYEERLAELEDSLAAGEIGDDEFEQWKQELQKNLVADAGDEEETPPQTRPASHAVPLALALLVPLFAVTAYSDWGLSWGAIEDYQIAQELQSQQADPHNSENMAGVVSRLESRLKSQPENHQGWYLLGQSYMSMGMYTKAVEAFQHLEKTYPNDAGLASYLAEALYLADSRRYTPRVRDQVEHTLELDPQNIGMLEMRGVGMMQQGRPRDAVADFRAALAAGASGRRAEALTSVIERLQKEAGIPADETAGAQGATAPSTASTGEQGDEPRRVNVRVEMKEGLDLKGDEAVFVFARALDGPPMPLAVQRLDVSALPDVVSLDESMAMMPGMGLANFDKVQVVARISTSGIANASPDDFEAVSGPVDLTSGNPMITLRISERVGRP